MVEKVKEQLAGLNDRQRRIINSRFRYRQEKLLLGEEIPPQFGAVVIPSYGMSRWETGNKYRLSFFSGVVCKAAFEAWKTLGVPKIIIEGARIFPGDPKNDGDLMKDLLMRLGVPEEAIVQRRNNHNTYEQILDSKRALAELEIPQHEALYVYPHLHRRRIPRLLNNYGMNSHQLIAENVLSETYPKFAEIWDVIRDDPSYHEKAERPETLLTLALLVDRQGWLARKASERLFPHKGADVPDVRHLQTVRSY